MKKPLKLLLITFLMTIFATCTAGAENTGITVDDKEYYDSDVICSAGKASLMCNPDYLKALPIAAVKNSEGQLTFVSAAEKTEINGKCKISFDVPQNLCDSILELYFLENSVNIKPLFNTKKYLVDNCIEEKSHNYSNVYLSSRWFRLDGRDNQPGTLDILKRFMATSEKWAYISNFSEIEKIKNLGVSFQNAVNINIGNDNTSALLFDGTVAIAPWMSWGAKWSCVNNPVYKSMVWEQIKTSVDNGVTEIQFDDWASNVSAISWGGCFCNYCMEGFSKYVKEHCSASEILQYGIEDINTFNYKSFLQNKYQISKNDEYKQIMYSEPLYSLFERFQTESVRNFHSGTKSMMNEYAGHKITYTHNVTNLGTTFNQPRHIFCYDIFDGGVGETKTPAMEFASILTTGYLSQAIDKPYVYSPIPDGSNMKLIRQAVALCYATGQHILVPWDIWLYDSVRYFTTLEEIGDLFHFVRQYPYLFDKKEVNAEIGVIVNLDECTVSELTACIKQLFASGVPFKLLVSKKTVPAFGFDKNDLEGLSYLIGLNGYTNIDEREHNIIEACGIPLVGINEITGNLSKTSTDKSNVFSAIRKDNDSEVIHILNRNSDTVSNVAVKFDSEKLKESGAKAMLYLPGENPETVEVSNVNGKYEIVIPKINEWAVVYITGSDNIYLSDDGWSGIQTGTKTVASDVAFMKNGIAKIKTHGFGLGGQTKGDDVGTQDRIGFVYKNIGKYEYRFFDFSAKIVETEGKAGIIIREYPNSNSKYVALEKASGGVNISYRLEDNALAVSEFYASSLTEYLKISYDAQNGEYLFFVSEDGKNWQEIPYSVSLSLKQKLAGVYGTSVSGKQEESIFSDIHFEYTGYASVARPLTVNLSDIPQLEAGSTAFVKATVSTVAGELSCNQFEMSYESGNNSVFSVDENGVITALKAGSATLTVTAKAGNYKAVNTVNISVVPKNLLLAEENFESGTLPPEWTYKENTEAGGYLKIINENGRGKVLTIYDNVKENNIAVNKNFRVATEESVIAEFDFKAKTDSSSKSKGSIVFYTYDSLSTFATSLLTSSNKFYIMENNIHTPICNFSENVWYHIKLEMHMPQCRQTITISNNNGVVYKGTHDFRNKVSDLAKLSIGGNVDAVGTYSYWDNLSVSIAK